MQLNNHIFDMVEKYISGQMTPEEVLAFELQYKNDPEFAEEADRCRRELAAIEAYGESELKKTISLWHDQEKAPVADIRNRSLSRFSSYLLPAAAIALLLVIGYYLLQPPPSMAEMYTQYADLPAQLDAGVRAENGAEWESQWLKADQIYRSGKFQAAALEIERMLSEPDFPYPDKGYLYLGICRLRLDAPAKALVQFARVSPESVYINKANWYSLLAHLATGNQAEAIRVARQISSSPRHYKKEAATQILKDLE